MIDNAFPTKQSHKPRETIPGLAGLFSFAGLRQNLLHDIAVHVGQPVVAAGVAVGEPLVVEAQQVQHRGVQVVDVDAAADHLVAEFVGLAVTEAAFHAAAGQKRRKAFGLVFAAVRLDRRGAREILAPGRAAEFAGPDDQRVVQQAAGLEVGNQGRDRLVGLGATLGQRIADIAVMVPAADRNLDEAHARLAEPPRQQAGAGVLVGWLLSHAIPIERLGRLARQVDELGRLGLHAERELVRVDHALHHAILRHAIEQPAVHRLHEIDLAPLLGRRSSAGRSGSEWRIAWDLSGCCRSRFPDVRPAEIAEPCAPDVAAGVNADKARHVLVLGAQAVTHPGAHRRPHFVDHARIELQRRQIVGRIVDLHAVQKAQFVGHSRQVRHQVRDHRARLAARANLREPGPT